MAIRWDVAPDVQGRIHAIVEGLAMAHIDPARIVCMRSTGSKGRFLARIWPLAKVWQMALGVQPHYIIEVKAERFDRMKRAEQDRVLIHELLHIPRNFSGAVLPHRHHAGNIDGRTVERYYGLWEMHQQQALEEPTSPYKG